MSLPMDLLRFGNALTNALTRANFSAAPLGLLAAENSRFSRPIVSLPTACSADLGLAESFTSVQASGTRRLLRRPDSSGVKALFLSPCDGEPSGPLPTDTKPVGPPLGAVWGIACGGAPPASDPPPEGLSFPATGALSAKVSCPVPGGCSSFGLCPPACGRSVSFGGLFLAGPCFGLPPGFLVGEVNSPPAGLPTGMCGWPGS